MGQQWERELRSVLSGDPEGVRVVTRSCSAVERSMALRVIERPFLVIRAAGSGAAGVGDILAIRGDLFFPIEVKSSKNELIYLSGRTKEQLDAMLSHADRCGIVGLYAFRLKGVRGDSWRMFRIDSNSFTFANSSTPYPRPPTYRAWKSLSGLEQRYAPSPIYWLSMC